MNNSIRPHGPQDILEKWKLVEGIQEGERLNLKALEKVLSSNLQISDQDRKQIVYQNLPVESKPFRFKGKVWFHYYDFKAIKTYLKKVAENLHRHFHHQSTLKTLDFIEDLIKETETVEKTDELKAILKTAGRGIQHLAGKKEKNDMNSDWIQVKNRIFSISKSGLAKRKERYGQVAKKFNDLVDSIDTKSQQVFDEFNKLWIKDQISEDQKEYSLEEVERLLEEEFSEKKDLTYENLEGLKELFENTKVRKRRTVEQGYIDNLFEDDHSKKIKYEKEICIESGFFKISTLEEIRKEEKEMAKEYTQVLLKSLYSTHLEKTDTQILFSKNLMMSWEGIQETLHPLFGYLLTDEMTKHYKLNGKEKISLQDFHALIIGMTANLNKDNIHFIIKAKAWDSILPAEKKQAFEKVRNQFEKEGSIQDQDLFKILETLRDVLIPNYLYSADYAAQLGNDIEIHKMCKMVHHYAALSEKQRTYPLKRFITSEFMARDAAYGLYSMPNTFFQNGLLFPCPVFNPETKETTFEIKEAHKMVFEKGLYGFAAFSPYLKKGKKEKVYFNFRGTYDTDSGKRDVSPWEKRNWFTYGEGAGGVSFEEKKTIIENNITNFVKIIYGQTGEPVPIEFSGHSLGGSDEQRGMVLFFDFLEQANKKKDEIPLVGQILKKIDHIELNGWGAPKVETDINDRFMECIKNFPNLPINLIYHKVHHDPVPQGGMVYLGAHRMIKDPQKTILDPKTKKEVNAKKADKPSHLTTTVIKYVLEDIEENWGRGFPAHTLYCLVGEEIEAKAYIAGIRTNNPEYAGIAFGKNGEKISEVHEEVVAYSLANRKLSPELKKINNEN